MRSVEAREVQVFDIRRLFHPESFPRPLHTGEMGGDSVCIESLTKLIKSGHGWSIAGRWGGRDAAKCGLRGDQLLITTTLPNLFFDSETGLPPDRFVGAVALLVFGYITEQLPGGKYSLLEVIGALSVPHDIYEEFDPRRITDQRPPSERDVDLSHAISMATQ